jgi:DNA-binding NarL/FixJ family response regulator
MLNPVNIIIADDHQIVIDGIKALLGDESKFNVIDTALNGKELIDKVKQYSESVNLVITDIQMPELNGIDAISFIKKTYPDIKTIALTMHNEKALINSMEEAGASAYILKNIGKDELQLAIETVMAGNKYFSGEVTQTVLNTDDSDNYNLNVPLTQREQEIVKLIVKGHTNIEIGDKLFISHRTVDTHRTNIMKKINAKNVAALIKYALQKNMI